MAQRVLVTGGSGFIGTNLVDALEGQAEVINLDIRPPLRARHGEYWVPCDIMDRAGLEAAMARARPDYIVHLAARTDCDESTSVEEGYQVNTVGTQNVLDAVAACASVRRLIVTSTQYVSGPEHTPDHQRDFAPHTVYGASKVITEQLTRNAGLAVPWTIIRPVNIWGPWHERYRREFWRVAARGLYVHPAGPPVFRTYGYVGNVVWQIGEILSAPSTVVHEGVFYVGDRPIDVFDWADAFCRSLRGSGARRVPRVALRTLAALGDVLSAFGVRFPLTTSRYRNMIQGYDAPIEPTFETFGPPPYSLTAGVRESVSWLRADATGTGDFWRAERGPQIHLPETVLDEGKAGDNTELGPVEEVQS